MMKSRYMYFMTQRVFSLNCLIQFKASIIGSLPVGIAHSFDSNLHLTHDLHLSTFNASIYLGA